MTAARTLRCLLALTPLLLPGSRARAADSPPADEVMRALIDMLAEVDADDRVKGGWSDIQCFIPSDRREMPTWSPMLYGGNAGYELELCLVRHGAAVLPLLLAHLDDERPS